MKTNREPQIKDPTERKEQEIAFKWWKTFSASPDSWAEYDISLSGFFYPSRATGVGGGGAFMYSHVERTETRKIICWLTEYVSYGGNEDAAVD